MRIQVMSIGRLRSPYVDDIEHYAKMLSRYTRLKMIEVRDDRALERRLPKQAFLCMLDRDGVALDSREFALRVGALRDRGVDLCFVVGGPRGIDDDILNRADLLISLGPMTLPHQLARVVLVEQIFRAHRILAGEPYHY